MTTASKLPAVSIFTGGTHGHLSIAQSIYTTMLKHRFKGFLNQKRGPEDHLYTIFYLFFPQLFKIPVKLLEDKRFKPFIHNYLDHIYQNFVLTKTKTQKPQVIISTYPGYSHILETLNFTHKYLYINIIPDPRTFSDLSVSPDSYNLTFDKQATLRCLHMGIPKQKIIESGWFVRDQFEQPYSKIQVRKSLNLPLHQFTLLVVSGSEGTNAILKIAPTFINCPTPITVIFACGTNQTLLKTLKTATNLIHSTYKNNHVNFLVTSFTANIYSYIQAADLVIGKAGPNLLFETVATRTPFFAITHMSGQEDGNLDIIKEYQLGFIEEKPRQAIKLLRHIIAHPQELEHFQAPLDKLAKYNTASKHILIEFINKHLN